MRLASDGPIAPPIAHRVSPIADRHCVSVAQSVIAHGRSPAKISVMAYPEFFVAPMRAELADLGFEELRTPGAVDDAVQTRREHCWSWSTRFAGARPARHGPVSPWRFGVVRVPTG